MIMERMMIGSSTQARQLAVKGFYIEEDMYPILSAAKPRWYSSLVLQNDCEPLGQRGSGETKAPLRNYSSLGMQPITMMSIMTGILWMYEEYKIKIRLLPLVLRSAVLAKKR